jgi:hypothetical protein
MAAQVDRELAGWIANPSGGVYLAGLYATTGLYLLYLVMAFVGYRSWRRSLVRSS